MSWRSYILTFQYEVDSSKPTNEREPEEKDTDSKTRAHQQPSLEGESMPVASTVESSVPNSNLSLMQQ